jgi:hypothetical protein
VKLVTYDVGRGARVGVLEGDDVLDVGFDGDMVAFIEAGAPVGETTPVENARLLPPLKPRSLRDFLAFEGHLKNAFERLNRPIPEEWYEVPAFYRGMPDTVIGPDEESPGLTEEAARWISERGPKSVGCDFFEEPAARQPGWTADEFVVHLAILGAGIPLIEGLVNLRDLPPRVQFFAPFYKFKGIESAPARAFALIDSE